MLPPNSGFAQYNSRRRVSWVAATPIRPMYPPGPGAEMRVAGTRAVNRALRKAYGIGIYSVEEIGSFAEPARASPGVEEVASPLGQRQERQLRWPQRSVTGLSQLIRQYKLDAA